MMKEEDYDVIEIQGKHGLIELHVPKREASQEEIDELHKSMAEIALNIYKDKQVKKKEN
ncbi:hypothetical protein [Lederbergia lenta]|uniref:hypothetical protein n=1 Tax=Lederbergia lenta TaxID=1467 RepID=UPI002041CD6F|nr:hypothetical protein [Lederbergia lenta]MCM3109979.1 hypothetical protein [Lederbergia lenta]